MLPRVLGSPGVQLSCWRWPQAAEAVALDKQEGRRVWVRAHFVIIRPVSVGNQVSNFFLIGLNGKAFIERLSVSFFFSFSVQTRQLSSLPKCVPAIEYHGVFVIKTCIKKCNLTFYLGFPRCTILNFVWKNCLVCEIFSGIAYLGQIAGCLR